MKLRFQIIEPDQDLRELLRTFLTSLGHEVQSFPDPGHCPLFNNPEEKQCSCPRQRPCADIVLVEFRMPSMNAFDFLNLQRQRGCKVLDANKAVMCGSLTKGLEASIWEFGCHLLKKPFRLLQLKEWIDECATRLSVCHSGR